MQSQFRLGQLLLASRAAFSCCGVLGLLRRLVTVASLAATALVATLAVLVAVLGVAPAPRTATAVPPALAITLAGPSALRLAAELRQTEPETTLLLGWFSHHNLLRGAVDVAAPLVLLAVLATDAGRARTPVRGPVALALAPALAGRRLAAQLRQLELEVGPLLARLTHDVSLRLAVPVTAVLVAAAVLLATDAARTGVTVLAAATVALAGVFALAEPRHAEPETTPLGWVSHDNLLGLVPAGFVAELVVPVAVLSALHATRAAHTVPPSVAETLTSRKTGPIRVGLAAPETAPLTRFSHDLSLTDYHNLCGSPCRAPCSAYPLRRGRSATLASP